MVDKSSIPLISPLGNDDRALVGDRGGAGVDDGVGAAYDTEDGVLGTDGNIIIEPIGDGDCASLVILIGDGIGVVAPAC